MEHHLAVAIAKSGEKKFVIARKLSWHPSKLSNVLNGIYTPSSLEREKICSAIGCNVAEAFPSQGVRRGE